MRPLLALLLLALAACDSGAEPPPLFDALEGTWAAAADADPPTVRFLPEGRYEFVADGGVTERGRFSLAWDGDAADPDALPALRNVQFYPDDDGLRTSYFTVASADATALSLQRCSSDCEGAAVQVYRRQ